MKVTHIFFNSFRLLRQQYEATDLFLSVNGKGMDDNMHMYMVEAAIKNFNERFKTSLKVNYNYKQHESSADAAEIDKILSELGIERTTSSKKAAMSNFKLRPTMKVLTTRRRGSSRALQCPKEHGPICHACPAQREFRVQFFGSNIYAIFLSVDVKELKCLLCVEKIESGNLTTHFQNDCEIFNPLSSEDPHAP